MNSEFKWVDGRTLDAAELGRIAEIDNQIPAEFDPSWNPDEAARKERVEFYRKLSEGEFFRVIYRENEVVGFHIVRNANNSMCHTSTLWVHPSYRRMGLGKSLKEAGIAWARERGFKVMQTGVHVANKRMTEINLTLGFKPHSVVYRMEL